MNRKIQLLDKKIAELIAAGEVVDRPASVVKELIENSIDAGASSVTVEIHNGGISYIRITDNGCGIAREDVPTAFLRHATSKVRSADDLDAIRTLGFRGEALASICSVAHVEMLTRSEEEAVGTRYCISGGEQELLDDAGCPKGTTLIIRDLFYNTPARMKFLKKDVAEGNAVVAAVDRVALSHPEVSFKLIRDAKQVLLTPGDGKLISAIHAVYGREFASELLKIEYELNGVRVSGYISKPSAARHNRSMQTFFINGRFVKTQTAAAALEEGGKGSVMVGKHLACVLCITITPEAVDVNVHPAKIEVRLVNERIVFDAVYYACKNVLSQRTPAESIQLSAAVRIGAAPMQGEQLGFSSPAPQSSFHSGNKTSAAPAFSRIRAEDYSSAVKPKQSASSGVRMKQSNELYALSPSSDEHRQTTASSPAKPNAASDAGLPRTPKHAQVKTSDEPLCPLEAAPESPAIHYVGEAFATYILIESSDDLLLIDKHAAHERMLYERLKSETRLQTQLLLSPITVTLDADSYTATMEHVSVFASLGIEIEDFGSGTVLVRSVPLQIPEADAADLVVELSGKLADGRRELTPDVLESLYHSVACRAAIKGGDRSAPEDLYRLAIRTFDENIMHCPHGRPVAIRLTRQKLEKQFGRLG